MAVRLSVIMIHTPPATASAQQLSEAIIGELIGRPGIDMTLVGRLSELGDGSTDRLTLESLAGDVAVLDWQSPEEIVTALAGIGFDGERSPHPDDPDPAPVAPPTRRIYAFDLRRFDRAGALCEAVLQLLASRQVRTFALGTPPSMAAPTQSTPAQNQAAGRPSGATRSGAKLEPRQRPTRPDVAEPRQSASPTTGSTGNTRVDLDALVDELDQIDP